jgi:competence protein ComEC
LALALRFGAAAGAGLAGWRAVAHAREALPPALEGRDIELVGVVAQMPQRADGAVRFLFDVESARGTGAADGGPLHVPPRFVLGWYAQAAGLWGRTAEAAGAADPDNEPPPVHAGERWRLVVRPRAPHGTLNPHGFDLELRLWEAGVHATGNVRGGAAPERLGATWRHPVERAREAVRDAVFRHVADPRLAGVVAALAVGDQAAIDLVNFYCCLLPDGRGLRGETSAARQRAHSLLTFTLAVKHVRLSVISQLPTLPTTPRTVEKSSRCTGAS